jgi:hypothetical protein
MSRETHVQFCEGLGVQLPGATHPNRAYEPAVCLDGGDTP